MQRRDIPVMLVLLVACTLVSCTASGTPRATRRSPRQPHPSIVWRSCGTRFECGRLSVPLDWKRRAGARIALAIYRHRASQPSRRVGALLANPGGPGGSGRFLAEQAREVFPKVISDRFDIVSWDPRGVGASTAIRCGERLDAFYGVDRSPDTPAEIDDNIAAARTLARGCKLHSGALLRHVSTADTVIDMDAIRAALREPKINYVGFSYGTYLGSRYAVRYPTRVRAMVLDGAVDPALDAATSTLQQSLGFEASLNAFLADCSRRSRCPFHSGGNARGALDRLLAQIDAEPLFASPNGERRSLRQSEAVTGIATALYGGRAEWPRLATALASASGGDASELLTLSDEYTERRKGGRYSNLQEAFYAISCSDGQGFATLGEVEATAARAMAHAPVLGVMNAWLGLPCVYWDAPVTALPGRLDARQLHQTIVVVASTGDPATPHAWGISLAHQLDARVVSVATDTHTAYLYGNTCVRSIVNAYLLTAIPPPADANC